MTDRTAVNGDLADDLETVTFIPGDLSRPLGIRMTDLDQSPGDVARRDLARYYRLLDLELARFALKSADILTLVISLQPPVLGTRADEFVWGLRDDAIDLDDLARSLGKAGAPLVKRLRRLPTARMLALLDAIERVEPSVGFIGAWRASLRRVGLIRD